MARGDIDRVPDPKLQSVDKFSMSATMRNVKNEPFEEKKKEAEIQKALPAQGGLSFLLGVPAGTQKHVQGVQR